MGAAVHGDELFEWKLFKQKSKKHANKLIETRPDIVSKLNDLNRSEKERERKKSQRRVSGESGEWSWTGDCEPPDLNDNLLYEPLTEEERKQAHADERKLYEEMEIQRKLEQKEKRKQKVRERRELMKVPINPLPERELCLYEKIREYNIKERINAMEKSKFFDDLTAMKTKFGFYKKRNANQPRKESEENSDTNKSGTYHGQEREDKTSDNDDNTRGADE